MKWVSLTINGKDVSVAFDENSIHIYNAFLIKDDLKTRGYRWNPGDKSWFIKPGNVDSEMSVLKNNLQLTNMPPPTITEPTPKTTLHSPTIEKSQNTQLSPYPNSLSVADLRNRIDRLIKEGIRGNIWVRGIIASEIKNYKWASYLDLKDEDENKNMYFRMEVRTQNIEKINHKLKKSGVADTLEKDLPVFCNVEIHLPLRNVVDVRLSLLDILPEYTQSKIRNQREITLDKLKEEGIIDNQKKLIMPTHISRIGLITSEQGTSIKDIKAGLHPFEDKYEFYFVDSRMEGSNAVSSIIRAVSTLENHPEFSPDAIIIARGGGSEQSLTVFNDLELCRKICLTPIPIITAIGHEKDISAIEQCSWLTPIPSTPSGIGKYLQNRFLNLQEQLSGTITQLIHHFANVHQREMERIKSYLKHIPTQCSRNLKMKEERFLYLIRHMEQSMGFTVRDQEKAIASLVDRLNATIKTKQSNSRNKIQSSMEQLLSRTQMLTVREEKQVAKTIGKLDFEKRHRDNMKQHAKLQKAAAFLMTQAGKNMESARQAVIARGRLVKASDPQRILEKGFTLTMDEDNRVITSLEQFRGKENALLRFHDGSVPITKQEGSLPSATGTEENNNNKK